MPRDAEFGAAAEFARLAEELHAAGGVQETVEAVAQFALQAVSCKYASVTLFANTFEPEFVALTDLKLTQLRQREIEDREGPLTETVERAEVVLIPDTSAERRWSDQWREDMVAAGILSAMHLPLAVEGRTQAVLSVYGERPHSFSADDLAIAHILARHATVAIGTARRGENLTQAVDARKLVGQAMGILMERFDLDPDQAFNVLRRYSQTNNRKLRDVAQDLIDTRHLPPDH
ncbi:GAF and ANTAR domain-containing protein [Kribbella sp. NPDC048928]|uniref:GAF and ANTAR domain-containing protein n=1 Tax=Kribbella sp. NPDC048928 TaxID=3364111 RepID=UPI00371FFF0C